MVVPTASPPKKFDGLAATAAAEAILAKLDQPTRRSEIPIKPLVLEFFGTAKSGKDRQGNEFERWFHRRGFRVLIHQESDETEMMTSLPRLSAQGFEMGHFSYNFQNLVRATADRSCHLIVLNRGIFDNLWHMVWHLRKGSINDEQFKTFRSFLFGGDWIQTLDGVFIITCSIEEALRREYGNDPSPIYGSRMNPRSLAEVAACKNEVLRMLRTHAPNLPVFQINTTGIPIEETRDEIIGHTLTCAERRFSVSEDEIIVRRPTLMRQHAVSQPPQLKFRGSIDHEHLRNLGWSLNSSTTETDTYLTPKGVPPLTNDECFHLRNAGNWTYFIFKWRPTDPTTRTKIVVPIRDKETIGAIRKELDEVAVLTKDREIFTREGFSLTLDRVDRLGEFIEISAPTVNGDGEARLTEIIEELGLNHEDLVPETYLKLYLKKQK